MAPSHPSAVPFSPLTLIMVGLGRLELPTPRLSSVCSNQLSYRPAIHIVLPMWQPRSYFFHLAWLAHALIFFIDEMRQDESLERENGGERTLNRFFNLR